MKVSSGTLTKVILTVIMLTVLLSILPSLISISSTASYDLFAGYTNTTVYGTGPVAFAAQVPGLLGWFWVALPFIMIVGAVVGVFKLRRR